MAARSTAFTLSLLLLFCGTVLCAQPSLFVFNIDPSEYPILSAEFYAYGENGEFLRGLTPNDMTVMENLTQAPILSITCPDPEPPPDLSVVLSIDISGSMNELVSNNRRSRLDVVKEAAIFWVREMKMNPSACAITSFNNLSYINQHYSYDPNKLEMAINSLQAQNGTNYDDAMIGWPAGGLTVARAGSHKRVLVFLTDGMGDFSDNQTVIDYAKNNNIEVYCIAVGMSAPDVLKQLSRETGGLYFEFLDDAKKIKSVYEIILKRIQGDAPCHIKWLSKGNCFGGLQKHRFVSFGIPALRVSDAGSYPAQSSTSEFLSLLPSNLSFGAVPPGRKYTLQTKVKAVGGRITISGAESSSPLYTIAELEQDPAFFPRSLLEGEELMLTVEFSPTDTTLASGWIRLLTDGCEDPLIVCSGGYRDLENSGLRLTHPNGGEVFVVGTDTLITWAGVLPSDAVKLEYSIDGGATWNVIGEDLTGLKYSWHVPSTPSETCLARVTQQLPNTQVTTLSHKAPVVDVRFMRDGRRVVTLTDDGRVTVWDALRGTAIMSIGGSSRASQLALSPDGSMAAVGYAVDRSMRLWDLQTGNLIDTYPNSYYNSAWFSDGLKGILSFTPDSRKVVSMGTTVGQDSSLQLRDVLTGQIVQEIHNVRARHGTFSPDGSHFAIASEGGVIQIWDGELTVLEKEWMSPIGDISLIAFSGDSQTLLTASPENGSDVFITQWTTTGVRLHHTLLRNVSFVDLDLSSSDGPFLGSGSQATLRELSTGTVKRDFPGHSGKVNAARFNADGTLIATVSDDQTARIWATTTVDIASDESDTLWSIVAPEAKAQDVDFGRVPVRRRKDSVVAGYIRNTGKAPIRILGMKIIGPHATDFTILSGQAPFELMPDEEWKVELGFTPGNPGSRRATMQIITQSDTLLPNLVGVGVIPSLKVVGLLGDLIDFGKVPVQQQRDSIAVAVNVGTASMVIDSIQLSGPHPGEFLLISNPAPLTVQAGDTIWLPVAFLPTDTGLFNAIIELFYNDVGSPTIVRLLGTGIRIGAPAIAAPAFVQFEPQVCTSYRDSVLLEILNPGDVPLNISEIELRGDSHFTLEPVSLPRKLNPGEMLQLQVNFLPDISGNFSGELRLVSNASNSPELLIPIDGTFETASIEAIDKRIDLGQLCPGSVYPVEVRVKNAGRQSVYVATELIPGSSAGSSWQVESEVGTVEVDSTRSLHLLLTVADSLGGIDAVVRFTDTLCGTEVVTQIVGSIERHTIEAKPVFPICLGDEVQLRVEGGVRYEWFPSESLSCDECENPVAKPERTTLYYVTGYDASGCSAVDSVEVRVRENPEVLFGSIGRGYRVKPGDTVELTARLRSPAPTWAEVQELELEFRYDPSVLRLDPTLFAIPGDGTLLSGWDVELKETTLGRVKVIYRSLTGESLRGVGDLFRIEGEIFLANVAGTEINWSLTTPEGCVAFEAESGYVAVDSICGLNYRLFEAGGAKYRLDEPYPNPTTGEELHVDFSLGLDGPTRLELIDIAGNRHLILTEHLDAGEYKARLNTADFSGGVYFIRLESGDWSQIIPVRLLK